MASDLGYTNFWGTLGLPSLKQFLTFYPHTIDNGFAGYVIYKKDGNQLKSKDRKNIALIYAKKYDFIKGHEEFLHILSEFFEVHATIADRLPVVQQWQSKFGTFSVANHGLMPPGDYRELLRQCKIMVGMGFPYEGPTPLEAMASGIIFIQPQFNPPRGRRKTDRRDTGGNILEGSNFWKQKPMFRLLTSQVPFIEQMPFQRTIDYKNEPELRKAFQEISSNRHKESEATGHLPSDLTTDAIMQRMVETLASDACKPPTLQQLLISALGSGVSVISSKADDCILACRELNMTCATEYFRIANDKDFLSSNTGK